MSIFFPTLLAHGFGGVIYILAGIVIASIIAGILVIGQIVYMAKSCKPGSQKAQQKTRTLAKINLSLGIISFGIFCALLYFGGAINMVLPIVVELTMGALGLSLVKTPSNEAVSWPKKCTYIVAIVVILLLAFLLVLAEIVPLNFIDHFRPVHTKNVLCMQISPDNKIFATGSADKSVRTWDLVTGKLLSQFNHNSHVEKIVFSHDSKLLASYSSNGKTLIWDLQKKNAIATLEGRLFGFSYDDKALISENDKGIHTWDANTGKLVQTIVKGELSWSGLSSNGKIIFGVANNKINLWDTAGKLLKTISGSDSYYQLFISPSGKFLVYKKTQKEKVFLEFYNIADNTSQNIEYNHNPLLFSPNEKSLLTDEWQLFDTTTGKALWKIPRTNYEEAQNYSRPSLHGKTLAGATHKNDQWHIGTWESGVSTQVYHPIKGDYSFFQFDSSGKTLISIQTTTIELGDKVLLSTSIINALDIKSGKILYTIKGLVN